MYQEDFKYNFNTSNQLNTQIRFRYLLVKLTCNKINVKKAKITKRNNTCLESKSLQ